MGQKVVIGGNRLGSGNKMRTSLRNYERSTHNLSNRWKSSMGCGILYPCYKKIALRGDKFDIYMEGDCITIPTKGPLFGSFKMQVDFFEVPFRLYQGLLHNNPTKLGLRMNQVKLPKLQIITTQEYIKYDTVSGKFSNSCLLKYLGMSGIGTIYSDTKGTQAIRHINAIPALAYYDIFKCYYANKQEDNAYVITGQKTISKAVTLLEGNDESTIEYDDQTSANIYGSNWEAGRIHQYSTEYAESIILNYYDLTQEQAANVAYIKQMRLKLYRPNGITLGTYNIQEIMNLTTGATISVVTGQVEITLTFNSDTGLTNWKMGNFPIIGFEVELSRTWKNSSTIALNPFSLSNIDDMRYELLSHHTLGSAYNIDDEANLPYSAITGTDNEGITLNSYPLTGLVLKTYQNDIFNNWINTTWIDGPNGINELSKVQVVNNKFSMDALNFATKLYTMMNRVALTDGTYDDWQDVIYEQIEKNHIETPVYLGGMSKEIVFDQVVQTSAGEGDEILGSLAGKGRVLEGSKKGGHIVVKCREASYIIGIVSLTPRIVYTQGNDFDMTELESIDDLHKPAMDGIGFQDLIGERMLWSDTLLDIDGDTINRNTYGKLPAWIEYMTDVDKAYGDFADTNGEGGGYMVLNRNYEADEHGNILDATTYVDPSKYNYAFGYDALDSQNFRVELLFKTIARRKMSARIMPQV